MSKIKEILIGRETDEAPRLTDRMVRRGLRITVAAAAFGNIWGAMAGLSTLTLLLERMGSSGVMIGAIAAIQQIATLFVQVPFAIYTDRLRRRKAVWAISAFLHRILWFVPAFVVPLMIFGKDTAIWTIVTAVGIGSILAQICTALWYSWLADLVPERVRGRFWGRRLIFTNATHIAALYITGYILDLYEKADSYAGFVIVLVVGGLFGLAGVLVHLWVPESLPHHTSKSESVLKRIVAPFKDRNFSRLIVLLSVWCFAMGLISQFSVVYLKREFDFGYMDICFIMIASSAGNILTATFWGHLIDRMGAKTFWLLMLLLLPIASGSWLLLTKTVYAVSVPFFGVVELRQAFVLVLITNAIGGALYGGAGLANVTLVTGVAPKKGRTMSMAVLWSIVGIPSSIGALLAGKFMDVLGSDPFGWRLLSGTPFSYYHFILVLYAVIAWFIIMPLLMRIKEPVREMPMGLALKGLLTPNPVRLISNVYNLHRAEAAAGVSQRARAIRALGKTGTAVAVSDIIERLDDASSDVREEAATALGRIGSPEAIEALLSKLNDPNSDLSPSIARALRRSKDPRSVDALLGKLSDPDGHTRSETARTLGEMGDKRAVPGLMNMLQRAEDMREVSASSEALSRLGEIAAIYEILPRMKSTKNPVLKRSLAVAVADLLGRREEFYKVLAKEEKNPGDETERLLKDLRKAIQPGSRKIFKSEATVITSKIDALLDAYENGDMRKAFGLVFDLAIGIAALAYGIEFGRDSKAALEDIIWRDQRFGVGLWYLDGMYEGWMTEGICDPDAVDVMLGIYFLACQGSSKLRALRKKSG